MQDDADAPILPVAILLGALTLGVATVSAASEVSDVRLTRERMRILSSGVSSVALALWPLVWWCLIGGDGSSSSTLTYLAFLWPVVLIGADMLFARHRSRGSASEEVGRQSTTRNSGNIMIGAAWAMGSLPKCTSLLNSAVPRERRVIHSCMRSKASSL